MKTLKNTVLVNCLLILTILHQSLLISQSPPPHDWKKVTWRDKNIVNAPGLSQDDSGDEWWFSHKNLYDANGKQIGYVGVGYLADVVKPGRGDEAKLQGLFDEGSDSRSNPYSNTSTIFSSPEGPCEDFYDAFITNNQVNERRSHFRGMVARLDMEGNMIWCRLPNHHGDGLQDVVQSGQYVYVVGNHAGAKTVSATNKQFIPYNATNLSEKTSNVFAYGTGSNQYNIANTADVVHMYVAKYDLDGNKIWDGMFGDVIFSSGNASLAWTDHTKGNGILVNNDDGHVYAVGQCGSQLFVAKINASTGYLIARTKYAFPNVSNTTSQACDGVEGKSICQTPDGFKMFISASLGFNGGPQWHRGSVFAIDQNLNLLTGGGWNANNPVLFPENSTNPSSNIYTIAYHNANGEILAGVVNNCIKCRGPGANSGDGKIYRINSGSGALSTNGTNPSFLGPVRAYDLRLGVVETSDGGFAAVSATRPQTWDKPTSDNGLSGSPFINCQRLLLANNNNDNVADVPMGWFDTNPLIVKFNSTGAKQWGWSEDIIPNRPRTLPPGDYKRQECMYHITEAFDGGLVASGNCSMNHDDNYMVKLFGQCNASQSYPDKTPNIGQTNEHYVQQSETWNTSMQISSEVVIGNGKHVVITGNTTKIRFADSRQLGKPCRIVINPGGRLTITGGAEVTSVDNDVCPGSMWDGIIVLGSATQAQSPGTGMNYPSSGEKCYAYQGYLVVSSGTISNARCGVTTGAHNANGQFIWTSTGGVIDARNSDFVNNTRDIQILGYKNFDHLSPVNPKPELPNESVFENCRFQVNDMLADHRNPMGRMSIDNTNGVKIRGCKFEYNAGSAYPPEHHGYGILSSDATYKVEDCNGCTNSRSEFKDLRYGVHAVNILKTPLPIEIDHAIFQNTYNDGTNHNGGILMANLAYAKIDRCDFDMVDMYNESVFIYECKNYDIRNNIFQGSGNNIGIVASRSGSGNHRIYRNDFTDHYIGIKSQFQNSTNTGNPTGATDDGLVMNCNRFMGNNTFNIAMTGWAQTGYYPAVARDQGIVTTNLDKLVRNKYLANCGNEEQWHISQGLSTKYLNHAANTESYTRPEFNNNICGDPYLIVSATKPYDYNGDCISTGFRPVTNSVCPCYNCCELADINAGVATALSVKATEQTGYNSLVDGGDSDLLLDEIATATLSANALKTLLANSSPYLSDAVLITYFNSSAPANNMIEIHELNKPVSVAVWDIILAGNFTSGELATLTTQQADLAQSPRQLLESQLNYVRSELQFMYSEKIRYYLHDTLEGAIDTVIRLLAENTGELPNALADRVDAYAMGDYHERAFALCDSLATVPALESLMGLKHLMLELDTASNGIYKVLDEASLLSRVEEYAADSTLHGCYQARALLCKVYGKDMNFLRADPSELEGRPANAENSKDLTFINSNIAQVSAFEVYPNPAANSFNIFYRSISGKNAQLQVSDLIGRQIFITNIDSNLKIELNTETYNNGLYFVTLIEDGVKAQNKTIVIMK